MKYVKSSLKTGYRGISQIVWVACHWRASRVSARVCCSLGFSECFYEWRTYNPLQTLLPLQLVHLTLPALFAPRGVHHPQLTPLSPVYLRLAMDGWRSSSSLPYPVLFPSGRSKQHWVSRHVPLCVLLTPSSPPSEAKRIASSITRILSGEPHCPLQDSQQHGNYIRKIYSAILCVCVFACACACALKGKLKCVQGTYIGL